MQAGSKQRGARCNSSGARAPSPQRTAHRSQRTHKLEVIHRHGGLRCVLNLIQASGGARGIPQVNSKGPGVSLVKVVQVLQNVHAVVLAREVGGRGGARRHAAAGARALCAHISGRGLRASDAAALNGSQRANVTHSGGHEGGEDGELHFLRARCDRVAMLRSLRRNFLKDEKHFH